MSLVWKYRRGKVWYLAFAQGLRRPARSLRTDNSKLAEAIRAKEENDILLGQAGIKQGPVNAISYAEFVALFLEAKEGQGTAKGTLRIYAHALNAFGEFLGRNIRVHKIARETIQRHVGARVRAGRSAKYINNEVGTLAVAFAWGIRSGFLTENVAKDLALPKIEIRPPDYLKQSEFREIEKALAGTDLLDIIRFYVLTGCRRAEALAIVKDRDIDFESGVIRIRQPKQRLYRSIPITAELAPVLKRLATRSQGSPLLIAMSASTLYHRFKRAVSQAGITRNVRVHSLRHTFGTWLASAGVGARSLQDLMGHSSITTTSRYLHPVDEAIRKDLEKLRLPT